MAFCQKCGKELIAQAKFCPKCGNPTVHLSDESPSIETSPDTFQTFSEKELRKQFFPKRKKNWLGLTAISLLLCAITGFSFFFPQGQLKNTGGNQGELPTTFAKKLVEKMTMPSMNQCAIFYNNGKYGLMDKDFHVVVEAKYDSINRLDNGLFYSTSIYRNHLTTLWNAEGKELFTKDIVINYYGGGGGVGSGPQLYFSDPLYSSDVSKNGSFCYIIPEEDVFSSTRGGIIDKNGKILCETPYLSGTRLFSGKSAIPFSDGDKWGIITEKNEIIIEPHYSSINILKDNLFSIKKSSEDKYYQLINQKEEEIPFPYLIIAIAYDSNKVYIEDENGKQGIYDLESRKLIVPCDYSEISLSEDGKYYLASIGDDNDKVSALYTINGKKIIGLNNNEYIYNFPNAKGYFTIVNSDFTTGNISVTCRIISVDGMKIVNTDNVAQILEDTDYYVERKDSDNSLLHFNTFDGKTIGTGYSYAVDCGDYFSVPANNKDMFRSTNLFLKHPAMMISKNSVAHSDMGGCIFVQEEKKIKIISKKDGKVVKQKNFETKVKKD